MCVFQSVIKIIRIFAVEITKTQTVRQSTGPLFSLGGIKATMKKIITCLLTVFGITSACGQGNFENADVKGFAELIADSSVVILDVRTAEEYADGHIKGAILIDQKQGDFVEKAKATLSKEKTIAIYCRSGRRSANAADRLAAEGYRLVNLKGGIIAWTDEGMPITKE